MNINSKVKSYFKKDGIIYLSLGMVYHFFKYIKIYFFQCLFRLFKIDDRKIVVDNFCGRGYGDNGKAIVEELLRGDNKIRIVWMVKDKRTNVPNGITKVKYGSVASLYELSTSKIIIDNCRAEYFVLKRKGQYYIQTWHGSLRLKKVEKDAVSSLSKDYVRRAKRDAKNTDLMLSGNDFSSKLYRKAFWYNGEILEKGIPKDDILIKMGNDQNEIDRLKRKIGLVDEKILLYTPTFRGDNSIDCYNIDYSKLISALKKKWGGDWKIIVRLHPNISSKSSELNLRSDNVVDMTDYPDLQELMLISDICITDYSGVMFDFSYMKRPVFLYTTDLKDYYDNRGFYFDIKKLPYPIAQDDDELIKNIDSFSEKEYHNKLKSFFEKIGLHESGYASREVAKIIRKKMKKGV